MNADRDRSERPLGDWAGDLDSLWPDFLEAGALRAGSREQQRAMLLQQKALKHQESRVRPRLTRPEIVDAAIAVADAEGAEALSMRRIAQVLRSGTMSLYWHVANKDQLLDLMRDVVMAEIEVPEPSGDWRADLRSLAVSMRAVLHRHQWMMDFVGGRPPLGPHTLLSLERSLAALADLKLPPRLTFGILTAVSTYASGVVLREVQEMRTRQSEADTRLDEAGTTLRRTAWRDRLLASGLFPHFVRFLDANVDPDAADTMEERFEFGLDCLLDGIAARITAEPAE